MDITSALPAIITLCVLFGALILFVKEIIPSQMTALCALALLLITDVLTLKEVMSVFSNTAPLTIACMCVIGAALETTGVIGWTADRLIQGAKKTRSFTSTLFLGGNMFFSAFTNNMPQVIIMTPVAIALAKSLKEPPSYYLIPLAYATILGGICVLIGTSTNILVDGLAQEYGQPAFSMFEITGAGVIMALIGTVFLATVGRRFLPNHYLPEDEVSATLEAKRYRAEAVVPSHSPLIGRTINQLPALDEMGIEIIDLVRNNQGKSQGVRSIFTRMREALTETPEPAETGARSPLRDTSIKAGDRLVFTGGKDAFIDMKSKFGVLLESGDGALPEITSTLKTKLIEVLVTEESPFIGQQVSKLRLRRRYSSYLLALYRDAKELIRLGESVEIKEGDVLLVEGPETELTRLCFHEKVHNLSAPRPVEVNHKKAPIAALTLLIVIVLAAFEVRDIAALSLVGAVVVLITGCLTQEEAYKAIEWKILLMIYGMLGLSLAMVKTGVASWIVSQSAQGVMAMGFGPMVVLAVVYCLTSIMTEMMSSKAVAVMLTPIVIGLAESLQMDPRPLIVAVMFAASASFATPIGSPVNTYVYHAGNYQFRDFVKIGVPMNILMAITAIIVIPLFWGF